MKNITPPSPELRLAARPVAASAQPAQWQQALARAQGTTIRAQSGNVLPALQSRPAASEPTATHLPSARAELSETLASAPRSARSANPSLDNAPAVGTAPRANVAQGDSRPSLAALNPAEIDPLRVDRQSRDPRDAADRGAGDYLTDAAQTRLAAGARAHLESRFPKSQIDTVQLWARSSAEGVIIELMAGDPALDLDALARELLAHFAHQGIRIARLACNGLKFFDGTRGVDRLVTQTSPR